jgi:hypothetical protein
MGRVQEHLAAAQMIALLFHPKNAQGKQTKGENDWHMREADQKHS